MLAIAGVRVGGRAQGGEAVHAERADVQNLQKSLHDTSAAWLDETEQKQ